MFTFQEQLILDRKFISEVPKEPGCIGDMTLYFRPTIQGQSVNSGEDGITFCLCSDLGQAAPSEGRHGYAIHSENQLDLHVGSRRMLAKGISQEYVLAWSVCDDHVILLKSKEHPLQPGRGSCQILQADLLQGFVVSFNNKCPTIQVCMELLTAIYDGQELPLDVGIASLGVCEGLACKSNWMTILDDAGSQSLSEALR